MRERVVPARVLLRLTIRFCVGACRQQQVPGLAGDLLRRASRIDPTDPRGKRVAVVLARGELAVGGGVPEDVLLRTPHGQDCTTVLPGYRQTLRARVASAEPIHQHRAAKAIRRRRCIARRQQRRLRVQYTRVVAHDACRAREAPRHRHRVSRRSLCVGVVMKGIREECPVLSQSLETTCEL